MVKRIRVQAIYRNHADPKGLVLALAELAATQQDNKTTGKNTSEYHTQPSHQQTPITVRNQSKHKDSSMDT